ncbi:prephenate dehydratase domain-containing protein [Oerskovia sp. KBS0722]|uniref:prephenate dehydratase n=1 Tax=Oerskovia sp. KBS0722 TaxID=1179673 RepID=UPI00110D6D81|nr:prephenate dehydratase domain-containing protein [Oerskovia sp. KBS0722]QDW63937.1 prephenate dehydratase [Oerskovia sp. KBS0722]
MTRVAYLGPEGTFTHQAAVRWVRAQAAAGAGTTTSLALGGGGADGGTDVELVPALTVTDVYAGVASGHLDHGIVAIENSVEGYVVPSLDAIVGSEDVVAVDEVVLEITFDAFVRPGHGELTEVTAHPHGLAQCQDFVVRSGAVPVPASSNAAACRDATEHQIAIGPAICGELYGLDLLEAGVEDFRGARTRFLTIVRRDRAQVALAAARAGGADAQWRTMLALTPHVTGPGVLARITQAFGAGGVNLSSLITRPLKALEGKYVFVLTVDAAPWEPAVREVLDGLLRAGDSVKTLGVFPARGELDEALSTDHVPVGSVRAGAAADELDRGLLWA